jgi:integrase
MIATKPDKPSPDFPLYPHASKKWAKKIRGQLLYFGRWDDPAGALVEYRKYLESQSTDNVSATCGVLTVRDACNHFLTAKKQRIASGELSERTMGEYLRMAKRFAACVGPDRAVTSLTPADFASYRAMMAKRWNIVAVGNEVTRVRTMFRWVADSQLIPSPLHFGPEFKRASTKTLRRHRREQGKKLYDPEQIHRLLHEAGTDMRAWILLGINCAFGPADCATLPIDVVDLENASIAYARRKTEIERECPLWPETVAALRAAMEARPEADEPGLFLTHTGKPHDPVALCKRFRQVSAWAGIRKGGLYWLRHTFQTIAGGAKDEVAIRVVMGHADHSMGNTYREGVGRDRLLAVTNQVRAWLFDGTP